MATAARPTLAATNREITGKAVNRLRKEGRLPAVVFGHGLDSASVTLDTHDFEQLRRHVGPNALIDLSVGDNKSVPCSSSTCRSTRSTGARSTSTCSPSA